jgi:hypothetical protein
MFPGLQKLSSSINNSIERQMVQAASAGELALRFSWLYRRAQHSAPLGKLGIMKNSGGPAGDS